MRRHVIAAAFPAVATIALIGCNPEINTKGTPWPAETFVATPVVTKQFYFPSPAPVYGGGTNSPTASPTVGVGTGTGIIRPDGESSPSPSSTPQPDPTPLPLWLPLSDKFLKYESRPWSQFPVRTEVFLGGEGRGVHYLSGGALVLGKENNTDLFWTRFPLTAKGIALDKKGKLLIQIQQVDFWKYPELDKDTRSPFPLIPKADYLKYTTYIEGSGGRRHLISALTFRQEGEQLVLLDIARQKIESVVYEAGEWYEEVKQEKSARVYGAFQQYEVNGEWGVDTYRATDRTIVLKPGVMDVNEIELAPHVPDTFIWVINTNIADGIVLRATMEGSASRLGPIIAYDRTRAFFFRSYAEDKDVAGFATSVFWGKVKEVQGKQVLRLTAETKLPYLDYFQVVAAIYMEGENKFLLLLRRPSVTCWGEYDSKADARYQCDVYSLIKLPETEITDQPIATGSL